MEKKKYKNPYFMYKISQSIRCLYTYTDIVYEGNSSTDYDSFTSEKEYEYIWIWTIISKQCIIQIFFHSNLPSIPSLFTAGTMSIITMPLTNRPYIATKESNPAINHKHNLKKILFSFYAYLGVHNAYILVTYKQTFGYALL